MRIATWNVEWFDALFDDTGQLTPTQDWSGRRDVTKAGQIAALTHVFRALDADAIMVIEAPDSGRRRDGIFALETFAAHAGLRARRACDGFINNTQQEIALLFDPDKMQVSHAPMESDHAPRFDTTFHRDLDVDEQPEAVVWSKPPLEVAVTTPTRAFRMIGVHAKSKAPHGARNEQDAMRLSIANRRKQLAQCIWLRARVDQILSEGQDVIVLGDFNDGPGLDQFEKLFGRSGVEIVLGDTLYDPHARGPHGRPGTAQIATARFFDWRNKRWFSALLDFIMLSPGLMNAAPAWRILHPFDDPACFDDETMRAALLAASDHFPVVLEIDI